MYPSITPDFMLQYEFIKCERVEMYKTIIIAIFVAITQELKALEPYKRDYVSFITQNDAYFDSAIDKYYTAGHGFLYASNEMLLDSINGGGYNRKAKSWIYPQYTFI